MYCSLLESVASWRAPGSGATSWARAPRCACAAASTCAPITRAVAGPGKRTEISEGTRWFCARCGTHLYATDDSWPDGVWPNVGAIDTPLPRAPEHVFMMTRYKPSWVKVSIASAAARATPSTRSY